MLPLFGAGLCSAWRYSTGSTEVAMKGAPVPMAWRVLRSGCFAGCMCTCVPAHMAAPRPVPEDGSCLGWARPPGLNSVLPWYVWGSRKGSCLMEAGTSCARAGPSPLQSLPAMRAEDGCRGSKGHVLLPVSTCSTRRNSLAFCEGVRQTEGQKDSRTVGYRGREGVGTKRARPPPLLLQGSPTGPVGLAPSRTAASAP